MINDSITQVECEEGEYFYTVSYNQTDDVKIKKLDTSKMSKIYFEKVTLIDDAFVTVCAKSEEGALERAARLFQEFFEKMAREVPEAIYQELDNGEKWFCAKFTPAMRDLNLTCVREVPITYCPNVVLTDKVSGHISYFTFIQARDMNTAWEKAFMLFKDYTNTLHDTLDYIDSKKKWNSEDINYDC